MVDVTSPDERRYAKDVADWCARSLSEAKESGAFDTRCFVQNADLIIAALREYAMNETFHSVMCRELDALSERVDTLCKSNEVLGRILSPDVQFHHREDCADPQCLQGIHRIPVDCPREAISTKSVDDYLTDHYPGKWTLYNS